jgi:tetratricopeptide (TPR) repeat protein
MHKVVALVVCLLAGCGAREEKDASVTFRSADGAEVDLADAEAKVSYEVAVKQQVPKEAKILHAEAREEGSAGRYESAIQLLERASRLAPDWAYPVYDLAYIYLLQDDLGAALAKYRQVDAMEPEGFLTTKTAIWTLEREGSGALPVGTYSAYLALELAAEDEKKQLVTALLEKAPTFPPAIKDLALITADPEEKMNLIDRALALNPDAETYGILMLNRAMLRNSQNRTDEARAILQGLLDRTNTIGTRTLAQEVLEKRM